MKPREIPKFIGDRLAVGGWVPFVESMEGLEADESIRRVARECEQEEAERLRRKIGGLPIQYIQSMPHVADNPFIEP